MMTGPGKNVYKLLLVPVVYAVLLLPATRACWTDYNSRGMVRDAKRLIPENLQWVLDQYKSQFYQGYETLTPPSDSRRDLIPLILKDSEKAVDAFTENRSYRDGAGILGRIARSITQLHAILTDPDALNNPHWPTDYAIFLQKKRTYFRIRWLGIDHRPKSRGQLKSLLDDSSLRMEKVTRILTDTLNRENRNIASYDVRSAPFGVGSIAYSSAVNTMAMTWLYIWDKVGGISPDAD